MMNGYDAIKLFYHQIWCLNEYKPEDIRELNFKEYVSSMYDNLVETKYPGHEKYALHGLKMSSSRLKELILDTLFSNLYCEFLLMLQNLDEHNHAIKHEFFLTSVEFNKNFELDLSQTGKERFRRRMQSNRLNLINKVKLKNNDKTTFYSPSLIRAFKETLFIPRPNTNVLDISKNYADIFYSLMFDSDEESSSKHCKAVRERIKSYRLWNLAEDDCYFIIMIIQNVIDNYNNGDQFSQLMLLEKMFGLYTIAYFWENMDSFNAYNLFALATMRRFGYCLLHQQLINTMVSEKAHSLDVKYVVERFIYPICSNMLKRILKTILKSLENYDCEQSVDILDTLLLVCADNSKSVFTTDVNYTLQKVPSEMLVEMITAMNGLNVPGDTISDFELQLMGIVKLEDSDDMKNHLKKFSAKSYYEQFYEEKYKDIDYRLLYDPSFYDLTFTDKYTISKYELNKILNPHS